jgi:hypothetical protein
VVHIVLLILVYLTNNLLDNHVTQVNVIHQVHGTARLNHPSFDLPLLVFLNQENIAPVEVNPEVDPEVNLEVDLKPRFV